MRKNKQITKSKKRALLTSLLLSASALATLGACSKGEATISYQLPTDSTIEVGQVYKPTFVLESGVTATVVDLLQPKTSRALMVDGAFTPDVTGEYKYVVRFKKTTDDGVVEKQETVSVTAIDTIAPVINKIADKTVETGVYTGFGADIEAVKEVVTDNCAQEVTVYAESITFGTETTALEAGIQEIRLAEVGEYTVKVIAEDFSGNKASATYKMIVQDTTAPFIEAPLSAIAWAQDGKVTLPAVNVIDNAVYTLNKVIKDASGVEVAETDGKIDATDGVYTIEYTAVDDSGNASSAETQLIVKEKGTITDFTVDGEDLVWDGNGTRIENEKLEIYYKRGNTLTLEYIKGFTINDWSDFTTFDLDVTNHRGSDLSVTTYFYVDGAWKETAVNTLGANSTGAVKIYLSDYDIESVQGIRFALACDEGIIATMDEIKLSAEPDNRNIPTAGDLTGLGAGMYAITARGAKEISLDQPANPHGVITYQVYANVQCDVMLGLHYEAGSVYTNKTLKAGWNTINRYPDAESGLELTSSALKSMTVSNFENYDVELYVKDVSFGELETIDQEAYAELNRSYSVEVNEVFHIPTPFTTNMRWYKNLKIELIDVNDVNDVNDDVLVGLGPYSIGDAIETVGANALTVGNYLIRYSFEDLDGVAQTIEYALEVKKDMLTVDVAMPALFNNPEGFALPTPVITSSAFGDDVVQENSEIVKSYRLKGRRTWTVLEENEVFKPESNRTYEIRYVVTYKADDGTIYYREFVFEKFIHVNKNTVDFEPEDAVGNDRIVRHVKYELQSDGTNKKVGESYTYEKSRFYYDGGGYDYYSEDHANYWSTSTDWSKSGSTSLTQFSPGTRGWSGFIFNPVIPSGEVNAVKFWMKADKSNPEFKLEIGAGDLDVKNGVLRPYATEGWRTCEPFELKAGIHEYTVYLQEPIKPFDKISVIDFIMVPGNRLYIDDLEFIYIDRLTAEDTNEYVDQINNTQGYKLVAPTVTSEKIDPSEAKIVLTYSLNGKDPVEILPNADKEYILKLGEETGEVVFKWTVTAMVEGKQLVREFESNKVSIGVVGLDVAHEEIYLKGAPVTLTAKYAGNDVTNVKLEYKKYSDTKWTTANGMAFPTDTVGWYDIRVTAKATYEEAVVDGLYLGAIYVRDPNVFIDFEGSDPLRGAGYYGHDYNGEQYDWSDLVRDENGNTTLKLLNVMQSWEGVYFGRSTPYDLGEEFNTVKIRVHSSTKFTGYRFGFWWKAPNDQGTLVEKYIDNKAVDLQAGWNDVYLVYDESFRYFIALYGKISTNAGFPQVMYDDITFLKINFASAMPTTGVYGDEVSLPNATCDNVAGKISYRLEGTDVWTDVTDGKFAAETIGNYEVRYAFEGMFDYTAKVAVSLAVDGLDGLTENAALNTDVAVPAVTASYKGNTYNAKASYREKGTEQWLDVTENKFKVLKGITYEVRFYFEELNLDVVREVAASVEVEGLEGVVADVNFNDSVVLPSVKVGEMVATASYRVVGDTDWLPVIDNAFVAESVKGYEVRFRFDSFDIEYIKKITTIKYSPELETIASKVNQESKIDIPGTITIGGVESTSVSYRVKGTEEWRYLSTEGSTPIIAMSLSGYEIRYEFDNAELNVVKSVEVLEVQRGVKLLIDFETPFDRVNVTTYLYMNYWNDTYKAPSAVTDYCNIQKEADGNNVLRIHASQGWDGPYWKGGNQLDFTPTHIKFKAKGLSEEKFQIYVQFVIAGNKHADGQKEYKEPKLVLEKSVSLGDDWVEYTFSVPEGNATDIIRCIEFKCYGSQYFVDDIYAIDANA